MDTADSGASNFKFKGVLKSKQQIELFVVEATHLYFYFYFGSSTTTSTSTSYKYKYKYNKLEVTNMK